MTTLTDVIVPLEQEGTAAVVRSWFVEVGDTVQEGDPLVELETDKVVVEVPAPTDGVVTEKLLESSQDAQPGALLARLDTAASGAPAQVSDATPSVAAAPVEALDKLAGAERRFSPAVRRILMEAGLQDADNIPGSGRNGRVTKADALAFVQAAKAQTPAPRAITAAQPAPQTSTAPAVSNNMGPSEMIPHSTMRRAIADHMSHSVTTAPHVTAVFEADFSAIIQHRKKHKADFAAKGLNLTFTAYFIAAAVEAMKVSPLVNSRWHDDAVEVFGDVNIGVGTALGDDGLIVPVVHQAQNMSLQGIAARLQDMTLRARDRALTPQDTKNGTFTISNHGVSGSLVASPIIINQPQSAILGIGKLEKRVCVVEANGADSIQIRPKSYVSLTIDHRVIDGHQTNLWLTRFVDVLENWPAD